MLLILDGDSGGVGSDDEGVGCGDESVGCDGEGVGCDTDSSERAGQVQPCADQAQGFAEDTLEKRP